jgi:hypothetical protein
MAENRDDSQKDRDLLQEEEEAAAAEAAQIGGRSGMEDMDEAERASAEHGGGEAEGFEEAEKLLEDQATHGEPTINPLRDPSRVEVEESRSVYGEADRVESSETREDSGA